MVKYSGQTLRMHLAKRDQTFGYVQVSAASYFGLPQDIVFISDKAERGIIYLRE